MVNAVLHNGKSGILEAQDHSCPGIMHPFPFAWQGLQECGDLKTQLPIVWERIPQGCLAVRTTS